jgi:hypothetical protein
MSTNYELVVKKLFNQSCLDDFIHLVRYSTARQLQRKPMLGDSVITHKVLANEILERMEKGHIENILPEEKLWSCNTCYSLAEEYKI